MSKASDYSKAALQALPTLATSQFDDLKVETDAERVWLSRMTKEDGATGSGIKVEHKDARGNWK